jgi:hypothetical protein
MRYLVYTQLDHEEHKASSSGPRTSALRLFSWSTADGLFEALTKMVLEGALDDELTQYLGATQHYMGSSGFGHT